MVNISNCPGRLYGQGVYETRLVDFDLVVWDGRLSDGRLLNMVTIVMGGVTPPKNLPVCVCVCAMC